MHLVKGKENSQDLRLPQVDSKELEKSLTQRSFMTATDSVSKVLTSAQAVDGRDAFVKVISLLQLLPFYDRA